jgi:hypothetical protein
MTGRLLFIAVAPALIPIISLACSVGDFSLDAKYLVTKLQKNPCEGRGASLVTDLDNRILFICKGDMPLNAYPVSIGAMNFPKSKEDDLKTPVGSYALGPPRESYDGFDVFIPIGYPTQAQIDKGFTGGDVGVHGPAREDQCKGLLNVVDNWTDGCVALPSDSAIEAVAEFVRQNPQAKIHLYSKGLDKGSDKQAGRN